MSFLDSLIYGLRDVYSGATLLVRKSEIKFRNNLSAQVIGDQIVVDGADSSAGGDDGDIQINDGGELAGLAPGADGTVARSTSGAWVVGAILGSEISGPIPTTPVIEKSANYTLTTAERGKVVVVTATCTIKLPASPASGDTYTVSDAAGAAVTIDPNGGTIYGLGGNDSLADRDTATYVYDGVSINKWVRT